MIVLGSPRLGFVGGVERHVFDLARGLRGRGHRVALVHGDGEAREPERFGAAFDAVEPIARARALVRGARAVYLHKLDGAPIWDALPSAVSPVVAVHDHDATCVRSHRYLPVTNEPCTRAPGLTCIAHGCVVVRCRGATPPFALRDPFALARATRATARRARLVACSEFLRGTVVAAGVAPDRVRVVHPVPPPDPTPLVAPPSEPSFAFVGQVIRGKGLDVLLEALARVPAGRLVVAGAGASLDREKARAERLGLASRVEFLGAIAPERVRDVYDRARVLVVPSRWPEPFGMIGVEAMRRGRVVVGARHGGIPEWLDEGVTGLAFRPGDARDLARAMTAAVAPSSYGALATASLAHATRDFSFDGMLDRVERTIL